MNNRIHSGRPSITRKSRVRALLKTAAVAAVGLGAVSSALAADVRWNIADGNWADGNNWTGGAVPASVDPLDHAILDFATAGATAHVNSDVPDVYRLTVKNGNVLSIAAGGDVRTTVGNGVALNGTIVNDPLQAIRIGDITAGTLIVNDGTLVNIFTDAASNQSSDLYIGVDGGVGTFTQSGAASVVTARDFRLGSAATGTATLNDGNINVNWMIVGRAGGTGTLNVNGGNVNANFGTVGSRLQVADAANSTGTVNLSNGTITTTGEVNFGVGAGTGNGTGTMNHTGGLLTTIHSVAIGRGGTSTGTNRGFGTYVLGTDASSTAAIDVNFTPAVPPALPTNGIMAIGINGGKGDMVMHGGTINTDAGFYVGHNTAGDVANRSEGTLDLNAGTITVGDIFVVGMKAATGTMTMDGGTINVTGGGFVGNDDRTANGRTTLAQGTLSQHAGTINAAGGFTVATRKSTGVYTIDGTGVLNAGAAGTGNLLIGGPDAVTDGSMTIAGNADVNVAGALNIGQTAGKGALTMTGGTLDVTGNSSVGESGAAFATFNLGGGTATFGDNLTVGDGGAASGILTITAGTLNVTGTLIAGRQTTVSGVINQSGGTVTAGALAIRTGAATAEATRYNLSGGTFTTGEVANNSAFNYTGGTATVGFITGTGTTTVAAGLNLAVDSVTQGGINVDGRITVRPNSQASGVSRIGTITLGTAGKLDLTDNKLITQMPVGTFAAGAYDGVSGMVDSARGSTPAWNGPNGITTSDARAQNSNLVSIGVAKAGQVKGIADTDTATFAGQTVLGSDTIAMVTYGGDATLDGKINIDDYGRIDANVGSSGTVFGWYNGDFNYDGAINIDDYGIIDGNISQQTTIFPTAAAGVAAAAEGVSAVPEPASLSVLALGALGLMRRRRHA